MQGNGSRRIYGLSIGLLTLLSCSDGGSEAAVQPACVSVEPACQPLYDPAFDQVHARTLSKSCVGGGSACHSEAGARGGLVLEGADKAHSELLDGRITPGEAGCGDFIVRLTDHGQSWSMPPGRPLSDAALCSIQRWIADGAER